MDGGYEGVANITSTIQNIVVIFSFIVGGIWAYYKFYYSRFSKVSLEMNINIKEDYDSSNETTYVYAIVKVTNTGNIIVPLYFQDAPPFIIAPVSIDADHKQTFGKVKVLSPQEMVYVPDQEDIFSGDIVESHVGIDSSLYYTFVLNIPNPGMYYVGFSVQTPELRVRLFGLLGYKMFNPKTLHTRNGDLLTSDVILLHWDGWRAEKFFIVHGQKAVVD